MKQINIFFLLTFILCSVTTFAWSQNVPLPSWNDGPSKNAITTFVKTVTDKTSPDYVEPSKRIAVFDNDGCLWTEQPIYFQIKFEHTLQPSVNFCLTDMLIAPLRTRASLFLKDNPSLLVTH